MSDLPKGFWSPAERAAAMGARANDDRVAELEVQLAQEREKNAQFRLALRGIHALPIETDKTGHPCKRIPCSSMFDMGAELGEIVAAMDTDETAEAAAQPEGEQP